jgi:hypothetical protein
MIVQSPDQIEVLGLTDAAAHESSGQAAVIESTAEPAPPAPSAPSAPAAPAPSAAPAPNPGAPPGAPVPVPAPGPAAAPAPAPAPVPAGAPQPSAADVACARARQAWERARGAARHAAAQLTACLDGPEPRCAPLGDRLGPLLTDLEWAEQQLAARCPPSTQR